MTTRFMIQEGRADEFLRLVRLSMEVTRRMDSGTLKYEGFLDPDSAQRVLLECDRESVAFLEHAANLEELMPEFMAVSVPIV